MLGFGALGQFALGQATPFVARRVGIGTGGADGDAAERRWLQRQQEIAAFNNLLAHLEARARQEALDAAQAEQVALAMAQLDVAARAQALARMADAVAARRAEEIALEEDDIDIFLLS